MIISLFLALVGLSGGLIVGGGIVALITVLDLIPRFVQITKTDQYLLHFQWAVVFGAFFFTVFDFFSAPLYLPVFLLGIVGAFMGIFVGFLGAALTEVLNVIPILSKRMQVYDYLHWFIIALAFGKIVGSLFHWMIYLK
ncbi:MULTISPECIES: stage V sporulation protein AB [Aneurinibacillus]|uniref:Stage V sporulation protein AB n=1 Tax=Aneurinibacillus thermoaerophilus TaxID=143495 RepID=A0A1G7XNX7_ANETH|nr:MULTISPECIES: stage V sporulation protein AB [Aneurinibacillus]AMA73661.1 stage V sporulation protein AB [Aneurinibacillus sp. XH2]MED0675064.1 stage V sporulation protein AB [Aneurinibacillus thermoaerophilus]MED0679535.1 stage V sporulation protein AB [Aneurinibacillus thermoaerophilus]MED0737465.1 stage V sporulation protein AB [Aneurinibacillus thermoaerophilus]MED0756316.1 stage V sporulation protein AB [Aneurinibacillus thermoaerophilus]